MFRSESEQNPWCQACGSHDRIKERTETERWRKSSLFFWPRFWHTHTCTRPEACTRLLHSDQPVSQSGNAPKTHSPILLIHFFFFFYLMCWTSQFMLDYLITAQNLRPALFIGLLWIIESVSVYGFSIGALLTRLGSFRRRSGIYYVGIVPCTTSVRISFAIYKTVLFSRTFYASCGRRRDEVGVADADVLFRRDRFVSVRWTTNPSQSVFRREGKPHDTIFNNIIESCVESIKIDLCPNSLVLTCTPVGLLPNLFSSYNGNFHCGERMISTKLYGTG